MHRCDFWCAHVDKPKFNMIYQPLDSYYAANSYKNKDARGNYALGHVCYTKTQAPDPKKTPNRYYEIIHNNNTYKPKYGWRMSIEDMEKLIADDRIHFPTKKTGGNLYKKIYAHESKGKPSTDYWDDVHSIAMGAEGRKYPTQKPIKLLERIIEMSTDEGDIVLDPVAGSGTTGIATKNLKDHIFYLTKIQKLLYYVRMHYKEESNMAYSTDGSPHHSGIKTEKLLREYLQAGAAKTLYPVYLMTSKSSKEAEQNTSKT